MAYFKINDTNYTEKLARYTADLTFDQIPPQVIERAKLMTLHTLGCTLAAQKDELAVSSVKVGKAMNNGAGGSATVWITGEKLSPANASFVNSTVSDILDWEDCSWTGHPSASAVPVSIAMAEDRHATGREFLAALVASYAGTMSGAWADPQAGWVPLAGTADVVTAATPLAYMKTGDMAGLTSQYSVTDMFLGNIGGSLGEISALLLIVGGAYLIWRKVISWQTPAAYIATVAVLTFLFPKGGADNLQFMLYSIFGGGLMLGAFFMATDYVTSPTTNKGKLVFGIGLGIITCAIRFLGTMNEGVSFAILLMNLLVPYIEILTRQDRLGIAKAKAKKEGAAK